MEALTAASVAALTIYDMCKASTAGWSSPICGCCANRAASPGDYEAELDDLGRRSPGAAAGAARSRCRPSRCRSPTGSAAFSPRTSRRAGRSRPSRSRRWTAMRCAPRMSQTIPVELAHRRRDPGRRRVRRARSGPARRRASSPARRCPTGADTIVIQEDTERDGDRVEVREGAPRGRYVRRAGLDFAEGDVLLHAGRRLTPRDIGLAAAMNRPWLFVHRRPRVGDPVDRRRDRDARRPDRPAPDRQLERAGACRPL